MQYILSCFPLPKSSKILPSSLIPQGHWFSFFFSSVSLSTKNKQTKSQNKHTVRSQKHEQMKQEVHRNLDFGLCWPAPPGHRPALECGGHTLWHSIEGNGFSFSWQLPITISFLTKGGSLCPRPVSWLNPPPLNPCRFFALSQSLTIHMCISPVVTDVFPWSRS